MSMRELEIYVGNIPTSVTQDELKTAFKDFKVDNCKLLISGSKKYAFLMLDSEASIGRAMSEMNGYSLKGKKIVVRAGDKNVHERLTREMNSVKSKSTRGEVVEDADERPPPLELVFASGMSVSEDDDRPPPLEYALVGVSENDDDRPPPLEYAFPEGCDDDDRPPPLEYAFPGDLEDVPPPLEEVVPQRMNNPVPCGTKPAFQKARVRHGDVDNTPITLLVVNFPFGTTEEELLCLFEKYSPLKVTVILNTRTKNEKTYAYVTVPDRELAEMALSELDDFVYRHRKLMVMFVLERVHRFSPGEQ